ncbi:hypothetical protein Oscil6304_1903 [Oscillatoria acuminata PCC 6304]|uniref:Uncharacterized protein n=1 Tax=Oscillatoria acuminata PCC 6304 TaxID=56110 RepID=K9TGP3_9CYAN|nr:hypothetical protein Oscil6304_1903 [Oscillatoria acuminata PCC 6304]
MGDGVAGESAIAINLRRISITGNSLEVLVTKQLGKKTLIFSPLCLLYNLPVIRINNSMNNEWDIFKNAIASLNDVNNSSRSDRHRPE